MSTTTPPPGTAPLLPETLTDAHHDALTGSWEFPAYEKTAPPGPAASRRPLVVGLLSGALGLAISAGVGNWAQSERVADLEAAPPIVVSDIVPGYSVYPRSPSSAGLSPSDSGCGWVSNSPGAPNPRWAPA